MRKFSLPLFLIILSFISVKSFAQVNQDFVLVNKTGVTIYTLYVAPNTDSESWGPNILGKKPLKNGESIEITFDKSDFPKECVWDLKVVDKEGTSLSWFDINLCKYETIYLYYNFDTQTGTAEFE